MGNPEKVNFNFADADIIEEAVKPSEEIPAAEESAEEIHAEEEPAEEKKAEEKPATEAEEDAAAERKRRIHRKVLTFIMLAILAAVVGFGILVLSIKNSSSPVGYWVMKEGTSGGVTMTQEDAEAIGLNEVGSIRLDKSGDCKVTILGDEYEGKWTRDDDGNITITYDGGKTLTATIDDEGIMKAHDELMMEYTLEK